MNPVGKIGGGLGPSIAFVVAVLVITFLGAFLLFSSNDAAREKSAELKAMRDLVTKQELALLGVISGNAEALNGIVVNHQEFLTRSHELAARASAEERAWLDPLAAGELELATALLSEGDRTGLFDKLAKAKSEFLDKNNKHIARLSGYRAAWLAAGSVRDKEAAAVLDAIREERILIESFSPMSKDRDATIAKLREKNDFVVSELIRFWTDEVDRVVTKIPKGESRDVFTTCRAIFPKVTSTSFPALTDAEATLIGVEKGAGALAGKAAEAATVKLYERLDREVEALEKKGTAVWSRHDVPNVGTKVTPNKTLGEIIKCQQGLRINAEDIFAIRIQLNDKILPGYAALVGTLDEKIARSEGEIAATTSKVRIMLGLLVFLAILGILWFAMRATKAGHPPETPTVLPPPQA